MKEDWLEGNVYPRCHSSVRLSALLVCRGLPLPRIRGAAVHLEVWGWRLDFLCIILIAYNNYFLPQARRRQSPSLSLSPRLSNWNLSLQSERVQGLAGYCTQGPNYSPKATLSSPQIQLTAWDLRSNVTERVVCPNSCSKRFFLLWFCFLCWQTVRVVLILGSESCGHVQSIQRWEHVGAAAEAQNIVSCKTILCQISL